MKEDHGPAGYSADTSRANLGPSEYSTNAVASRGQNQLESDLSRYGSSGSSEPDYSISLPSSGRTSPKNISIRRLPTLPDPPASNSNAVNARARLSHPQLNTNGRHSHSQSNATARHSSSSPNGQSQRLVSWTETRASNANARANASARLSLLQSDATPQHHNSRSNANTSATSEKSYSSSQISVDPLNKYVSSSARLQRDKQTLRLQPAGNTPAVTRSNINLLAPNSRLHSHSRASNALAHWGRGSQALQPVPISLPALPSRNRTDSASKIGSRPDLTLHGDLGRVPAAQILLTDQKGAGLAPQPAKSLPQGSEARAATSVAALGDMTRSYLEGMVPSSEASSLLRHLRS